MDLKKAGCKKQGHCYSKREEARLPLLFLNNNDPVFCNLLFSGPYVFWTWFFSGSQTNPCFQNKNSGCRSNWSSTITFHETCWGQKSRIEGTPCIDSLCTVLQTLTIVPSMEIRWFSWKPINSVTFWVASCRWENRLMQWFSRELLRQRQ